MKFLNNHALHPLNVKVFAMRGTHNRDFLPDWRLVEQHFVCKSHLQGNSEVSPRRRRLARVKLSETGSTGCSLKPSVPVLGLLR